MPSTTTSTRWFFDTSVAICSTGDLFVLESVARRGDSPPYHVHRSEDELFLLLDGKMTLVTESGEEPLAVGQAVVAPKGEPHTYRVESETARWLAVTARGDFEAFVHAVSRPAEHDGLPEPSGPPTPEQAAALTELAARHGIEFV